MNKKIVIKGAKEHNLRNISVEIPKDKFVVITGLSGSGKSSLAFDTIYAEGQRRYVESLSAYARQFLDKMKKPKVDFIEGLSPAISIEQKNTSKNPRSTVATVTEIYDYMRVLYARIGTPYSPFTGKEIKSQTVSQIVDKILELPKKSTIFLFAPIVRGRKGEYKKEILSYKKRGFRKVKVDGTLYDIDKTPDLNKKLKHDIYILVDRIVINSDLGNRLAEGIETSLNLANGLLFVEYQNETLPAKFRKTEKLTFSSKFACPESGFTIEEIEPRLFSFNSPYGACEECEGIGIKLNVDPNLVVPDDKKSIAQGAIQPWAKTTTLYYAQTLTSLAKHYKFSMDEKWSKLPKKIKDIILYGSDDEEIKFSYDDGYEKYSHKKTFEGVVNNLERRYLETDSDWKREEISQYQSDTKCDICKGHRLKDEALCVKIDGKHISEVTEKSISDAKEWFNNLSKKLDQRKLKISEHILKEINERLNFLLNVGLDYLTLSRESGTLSGGEAQRIRLASQIGSGLTGVLYVLDEPSIGLHQKDNVKLINALKRLRDLGNTVIVVEHDTETIENADHILDLGPQAGSKGGEVVAEGNLKDIVKNDNSITGKYLSSKYFIPIPKKRRLAKNGRFLQINGASGNNLKNVDLKIPFGTFTCVTGVSGSGKSTLVLQTLYNALNLKQPEFRIPYYVAYFGAIIFDIISILTRKKFSISSIRVKKFCMNTSFETSISDIGFKANVSLEEAIIETVNYEFNNKNFSAAENLYLQVISFDSANPQAIAGLSKVYINNNDTEKAKELLDGLTGEILNHEAIKSALSALSLVENKDDLLSKDTLIEKISSEPANLKAKFDLANLLASQNEFEEAIENLLEIMKKDKEWNNGEAKDKLLKIFEVLGPDNELTKLSRRKMSSIIFS